MSLVDRYFKVRAHTESLAAPLGAEDQTVQSMPDASPTKWHRAHTTWFFETFLLDPFVDAYEPFHPSYGYLFNSYYEAVGARHPRPQRGLVTRPGVVEIGDYRKHVDEAMGTFLADRVAVEHESLLELGLHHEQQHQELLLMDAKHLLGASPMFPAYVNAPTEPAVARPSTWRAHDGGVMCIGYDGAGFSFDNESPRHEEFVRPFEIRDTLVTNGEWLAFIDEGGYRRPDLWMSDGWSTVQANGWDAPHYWFDSGDARCQFTLHGARPLDENEPVCHVSWYEADAFARWADCRLPTEAEWETAAPIASADAGSTTHPYDATGWYGQVWQWTASPYTPYPGFRPSPSAIGEYNGKFMVNQHVLRGSACVTPAGHARRSYRNFFPPHSRWAFSGLRLCR